MDVERQNVPAYADLREQNEAPDHPG